MDRNTICQKKVTCKILKLFVNTLTADGKYCLFNRGKLTQPIQIHLSQKQKVFAQYTCKFLKFQLNAEQF